MANTFIESFSNEPVEQKNLSFRFRASILEQVLKNSKNDKVISEVYKKILSNLIGKFSSLVYINDQDEVTSIPCWHGNAERVIAKIKQESNIVLPVLSVYRDRDELDEDRRRMDSMLVHETYFDKVKNRAVRVVSLAPAPTNITYKLSVWTKYTQDMDHVCEQIRRLFNPNILVSTIHNTQAVAFLEEEASSSEAVVSDGQDRILKRSFVISLETYIPNPKFLITNTGVIESINTEVQYPLS